MSELEKELLQLINDTIAGVNTKNGASFLSVFQREVVALNRKGLKRTEIMEIISQYLSSKDGNPDEGQQEVLTELYNRIAGYTSPELIILLKD
jgi:hypothetical protein